MTEQGDIFDRLESQMRIDFAELQAAVEVGDLQKIAALAERLKRGSSNMVRIAAGLAIALQDLQAAERDVD